MIFACGKNINYAECGNALSLFLIKIIIISIMKHFLKNVHINIIKMLYYDRIDVSKDIDVIKTSTLKECIVYHHFCFLDKGLKFQPAVVLLMLY